MLRTLFNKAAKPPYLPEKPLVLVSTLRDDSSRGDSHGYIGMGKIVAEKLGGVYQYLDEQVLRDRYSDTPDPEENLGLFLKDIGTPDIVFSRRYVSVLEKGDGTGKRPFVINDINENLPPFFSPLRRLVAHHLTPSLLREEGKKFDAAYPDLPRPLVAVMMADHTYHRLPELLLSRLQTTEPSTVFVCSGRRTSTYHYEKIIEELNTAIEEKGATQTRVAGYDFEQGRANNAYNPYMGLLNRADHIVVCGDSMSIVSEALATGKSVHLYENHDGYASLERKGLVSVFNDAARDAPLETRAITPLNRTEHIADKIISRYRRAQQRKLGFAGSIGAYLMDG